MRVINAGLLMLVCVAAGCSDPTPTPTSQPTPTPVVCESDSVAFEKKGSVHDDYQIICVEEGGYYVILTLTNETDQLFRLNLKQGDAEALQLYGEGRKSLDNGEVKLFEVCSSGCDARPGRVRIEVDAPDAPANVEWAVRIEKKIDST